MSWFVALIWGEMELVRNIEFTTVNNIYLVPKWSSYWCSINLWIKNKRKNYLMGREKREHNFHLINPWQRLSEEIIKAIFKSRISFFSLVDLITKYISVIIPYWRWNWLWCKVLWQVDKCAHIHTRYILIITTNRYFSYAKNKANWNLFILATLGSCTDFFLFRACVWTTLMNPNYITFL